MAALFHLQIVTPDRKVFDGEAEKIIVRTLGGDVCILARHIDYCAPLGIGEARVTDADGSVMATTFEWADEIDLSRAEKAQQAAQQRLQELDRNDRDFSIVEAKLKRALARIRVKG